jgi:tetratricopeptide (TPR) repeat protein
VTELNIPIDAAYTFARILVRSPGQYDKHVGRQILLQASQLGSAKATLHIVKGATKSDQLSKKEVQPALAHVKRLASRDPPIIPALVAQAKILELEQDFEGAAELYKKAIEHVAPTEKTLASRVVQNLRDRYSAAEDEAKIEPRITVEEKDQELDVVAAHLGLAQLLYVHLDDQESAIANWEIAAFEYDDPLAYFKLAEHIRDGVKTGQSSASSDPHDNFHWMHYMPYKWYEYTMKAAVSGHAMACFRIGDLYYLELIGLADEIVDGKLRRALMESPLANASPKTLLARHVPSALTNQIDTITRWYKCAGKAGLNKGYLAADALERIENCTPSNLNLRRSLLDDVALDGKTDIEGLQDVQWSSTDQELAKRLLKEQDRTTINIKARLHQNHESKPPS